MTGRLSVPVLMETLGLPVTSPIERQPGKRKRVRDRTERRGKMENAVVEGQRVRVRSAALMKPKSGFINAETLEQPSAA